MPLIDMFCPYPTWSPSRIWHSFSLLFSISYRSLGFLNTRFYSLFLPLIWSSYHCIFAGLTNSRWVFMAFQGLCLVLCYFFSYLIFLQVSFMYQIHRKIGRILYLYSYNILIHIIIHNTISEFQTHISNFSFNSSLRSCICRSWPHHFIYSDSLNVLYFSKWHQHFLTFP